MSKQQKTPRRPENVGDSGSGHPERTPEGLGDESPPIRLWEALARDVRRADDRRVILSSEFLAHARPDAIRRVVDDLGRDRVQVAVTLRPLSRILPSMWQQNIKAVTVPEFIVYLYDVQILSARSAMAKLDGITANTGQRVMQAARDAFAALAQRRGER